MKTKNSILLFSVIFAFISLEAATYRVTPDALGGGDGQSWATPMTINEAIAAATTAEDIILCKAGTYTPTATIAISTAITFKGGLKGTDDETLAENGKRSVFDTQNNTAINNIFSVTTTSGLNTFEGVEVRNAYQRGFYYKSSTPEKAASLSFKNCVFDSCGTTWYGGSFGDNDPRGAGGVFYGTSGVILSFDKCVFSRNKYTKSSGSAGHGIGAGFTGWKSVIIDNSLFVSNGYSSTSLRSKNSGAALSSTRGAAIYSTSPITARNTKFIGNTAGIFSDGTHGTAGGVVYIKYASATSALTNCLFLANSCEHCRAGSRNANEGGVIVVRSNSSSSKKIEVVNCTFAYNFSDGQDTSAGIDIGSTGSTAYIRNTIFYGAKKSRNEKGRDIWVSSGCSANIDYCLFDSDGGENIEKCIAGAGTKTIGSNNIFGNPKFARAITAEEIDSIMVNTGSFYGYSDDAYETVFLKANVHAKNRKLTVDTGDPASPYSNEPSPNGERVNLGYYGNTPEALSSAVGMLFFVR